MVAGVFLVPLRGQFLLSLALSLALFYMLARPAYTQEMDNKVKDGRVVY